MNDTSDTQPGRPRLLAASALAVALVLIAAVGAALWLRGDDEGDRGSSVSLHPGDAAPAFSLPGADNRTYALDDLVLQKKVLLYFSMGPG